MFYAWMRFRREQRRIKMDFLVHMQLSENVEKVKLFRMVFKAWLGLTKQGQGVRRVQLSLIQERMQEKLKARGNDVLPLRFTLCTRNLMYSILTQLMKE